jgi:16S rRNA pseudouridine516 synthase
VAERLDAFLSHHGFGSRSDVRGIIKSGQVTVAGEVCRAFQRHLGDEVVCVRGVAVERGPSEATLLLHKPVGLACSHDEAEAPLVETLIPARYRALPMEWAGRLDRDTSGLLIVTSDGQLIHRLTNPRKHLPKRYRIAYRGTLSANAVERCAKGLAIEGDPRPTLPAELRLESPGADGLGRATMILHEGRYHQVRKMIAACGGEVVRLHRDRIGTLDLPADLAPGASREISADELRALQDDGGSGRRTQEPAAGCKPDHAGDQR